ncbi:uncharacterized protein LOC128966386 [Oppia nitens]|uniref:uncharacterized protein LOC128966386 n=1 Tax=Oppia nitens TaxID=1686743 RepID=UPI0023DBDA1C|nr:uncharacterized protein LOC128966386 [Oppia nitens]
MLSNCESPTVHTKKSYLASIESLDDAEDTDDDSLGIIRMIRSKVNGCSSLNVGSNQLKSTSTTQQSPIPSNNNNNTLDQNLSHIQRVVLEIVETERQYVNDMQEIVKGYLEPMKTLEETKISSQEIINLFSNIEDINLFNSDFLEKLEECGLNVVLIAKCFIDKSSGFDIYTHYCTNYPRTVSLLTEMMRNTDRAELFRERQLSLKHSLPLGSYLLKPVQRILKYHLLLQNIVKCMDKETEGYIDIRDALSVMTNIAIHINDMKRKHEHAVRVQEIQSLLYNWPGQDLTTYGDLQCEGSFRMLGAKGCRHLFLFDRMLLITKKKDDGSLSYKTHILCSNLMLIESIQGQPLCFHAIPFDQPRDQYTFQARNMEHKREWCLLIKRVILENYDVVIPSHAKQIVMQLGQTANGQSDKSHSHSKRTLSAPEYLERRKQENRRKSESAINHNLSKGFKLRKSLKKIHYMDSHNGWRRSRSSSHDENARNDNNGKTSEDNERRSSLGPIDLNNFHKSSSINAMTDIPYSDNGSQITNKIVESDEVVTQGVIEEKTDNESLNLMNDANNMYELRRPRLAVTTEHDINQMNGVVNDTEPEYVTFYMSSNNNNRLDSSEDSSIQMSTSSGTLYNRTSTSLSSGSSDLSMASSSQSDDSKYVVLPVNALFNYSNHNLSNNIVRRVQSFTGMTRTKAILQHSFSLRQSLAPDLPQTSLKKVNERPNTLNLSSNSSSSSQLPTSNSLDEMSPIAPAIWLKRQEQHFATSCQKSGSLPRCFETTSFAQTNEDNCQTSTPNRLKSGQPIEQRLFTIAKDEQLNQEFNDPTVEEYNDVDGVHQSHENIRKLSAKSPSISLESVSDPSLLHPEHKIYRHTYNASKYIKSVIYNVGSKLVSLRRSPTVSDQLCADDTSIISAESVERSESPIVHQKQQIDKETIESNKYEINPKVITARFVHTLAKVYSNIIKNKLKDSSKIETEMTASKALSEIPSPVFARISMPATNSSAAARLANYNDYDNYLSKHKRGLQKHNSVKRPDSLVSDMSTSSDNNDNNEMNGNEDSPSEISDTSLDSFYEQTFEAIESVLTEEMFGESGFYSQHMDADSDLSTLNPIEQFIDDNEDNSLYSDLNSLSNLSNDQKQSIYKSMEQLDNGAINLNLNILSAKRVKGAIIEKLKILEENSRFHKDNNIYDFNGIKSIKQRMQELEKWCNNKENIEEIDDNFDIKIRTKSSPNGSPKPNSKGWVKHVIEKLQNDEN